MNADFIKPLTFQKIGFWMDGGTVTIDFIDDDLHAIYIQFTQTIFLEKYPFSPVPRGMHTPGSLVYNEIEVPVRSELERHILDALKTVLFKDDLPEDQRITTRETIDERISFIESEEYLTLAAQMGRRDNQ